MKKQLIYLIAAIFIFAQTACCSFASGSQSAVKIAAKKYKTGNYTGCLQDCLNIAYRDPSNALAYYYMAMSYAQAGQKDKAVSAYAKVLALKPNAILAEYATTGKRCLETPDKCILDDGSTSATSPDLDKMIYAQYTGGLSNSVLKDLDQKQLDNIKNDINNDKEIDDFELKKLNDASEQVKPTEIIAEAQVNETGSSTVEKKAPTNDEVAAAVKVLRDVGVNPYDGMASYQNPQAMQLGMLGAFNNTGVNNNTNDSMVNILPMLMAQSKTGQGNYSPQLMQAFIMNSMMGSMNMDLNKNSNDNGSGNENY